MQVYNDQRTHKKATNWQKSKEAQRRRDRKAARRQARRATQAQ